MKLRDIIWTAVVSAVAGIASFVCALFAVDISVVVSLAAISVSSALLSQREI